MPYSAPTVNYSATMNGTYTTLTGVQNVSFNRGRKRFIDPFEATSCSIELIPANSYALPLAVGQYIDVRQTNSSSSEAFFVGKITDVQRSYDIPYNSVTGAAPGDRITITALGPIGLIGRTAANNATYSVLANPVTTTDMISQTCARFFNVAAIDFAGGFNFSPLVQEQTTSNPPLDVINQYAASDPLYLADRDNARVITTRPSGSGYVGLGPVDFKITQVGQRTEAGNAFAFSDSGGGYKYVGLEFGTGAENTFTQVNVITQNVDGNTNIPNQTVSLGFAPFGSLNWQTFLEEWVSPSDPYRYARDLASYIFTRSYVETAAPFSLSLSTSADDTVTNLAKMNTIMPGFRGTIAFRGTTYRVTLEGLQVNFGVDSASIRAYFSPFPLDYFILDSAQNGVLDTNRLGYP